MRLIDADNVRDLFDAEFKKTRELILEGETHLDNLAEGFAEADKVIWAMPTVDAVPVVRCRDCKHHNKPRLGWCEVHLDRENLDDFCSHGKRKEGTE